MSKSAKLGKLGEFPVDQPPPSVAVPAGRPVQVVPGEIPAPVREKFQWVVDLPYSAVFVRTVPNIGIAPVRLDVPLSGRVLVAIQNLGNNGLWVSFGKAGAGLTTGRGIFLAGSAIPGAHLGGMQAWPLRDTIEVWGLADVGATDAVVIECGV